MLAITITIFVGEANTHRTTKPKRHPTPTQCRKSNNWHTRIVRTDRRCGVGAVRVNITQRGFLVYLKLILIILPFRII